MTRRGSAALRAGDVAVGDTHTAVLVDNLTRTQIVQYAGASGDYNPIHSDERFAVEAAGYPGVFAHGMLTMGMAGTLLTDYVGDGRLLEYGARFAAQVWPGDTLTGTLEVTAVDTDAQRIEVRLTVTNQDGKTVLTGTAAAAIEA
jgi:acyl dehydratase